MRRIGKLSIDIVPDLDRFGPFVIADGVAECRTQIAELLLEDAASRLLHRLGLGGSQIGIELFENLDASVYIMAGHRLLPAREQLLLMGLPPGVDFVRQIFDLLVVGEHSHQPLGFTQRPVPLLAAGMSIDDRNHIIDLPPDRILPLGADFPTQAFGLGAIAEDSLDVIGQRKGRVPILPGGFLVNGPVEARRGLFRGTPLTLPDR